ncbi:hypothetical protein J22TS3_16610 [Paenibacillus sp. J22TS3]|nr:hypothetical protein J22TS3_16610 [Paenibacillus sp. J22TS3]
MHAVPNTSHENMDDYLYSIGFSSAKFNKHKMFVRVALQLRAVTRRNRSFPTTPPPRLKDGEYQAGRERLEL